MTIAKLYVPSSVTAAAALNSTVCPSATRPWLATVGPSTAGFVLYVTVLSCHVPSVIVCRTPPLSLSAPGVPSAWSRSTAPRIVREASPVTSKRRYAMRTALASTASTGAVPKFVVGTLASTDASATAGNSSSTPATTSTVTVAVAVRPPRSVTVAVSW